MAEEKKEKPKPDMLGTGAAYAAGKALGGRAAQIEKAVSGEKKKKEGK